MSNDSYFKQLSAKDFRVKNPLWFGLTIVAAFVMFFLSQLVVGLAAATFFIFSGTSFDDSDAFYGNHAVQLLLTTLVAATLVRMIVWYLKWRGEKKPFKFMMISKSPLTWSQIGEVVVVYGLYFMTLLVATIVLSATSAVDVSQSQELGITAPQTFTSKLLVFSSLVVVVPIFEEILFRGFLFNKLKKYGGQIVSAIFVSVLFGIAHLEFGNLNWIAVVDTLIFSFFLIYISQKHKSLYSSILLHAMKNGIAFYVLFIR